LAQNANLETTPIQEASAVGGPIALYTDPAIRSVLISIAKNSLQLEMIEEAEKWSIVRHKKGFPVWIHSDFIHVSGDQGTITGDAVNARSIPMIIQGSVIEQLNKDETVLVLNQVREWYRVISPTRFKAWVRTPDFKHALITKPTQTASASPPLGWSINNSKDKTASQTKKAVPTKTQPQSSKKRTPQNSNEWLFSQPSGNYTIQLASFDTEEKVNNFLNNTDLENDINLHQFISQSKQISWTYFLYGAYPDKQTALEIKNNLENNQTWIRNIGKLQQNRCISWKKQLPTPKELNTYCAP